MEAARPPAEEHALCGPRVGRPHALVLTGRKQGEERERESDQENERTGQSSCQHPWAEIMFHP
jgi:hypothetical protein